MTSSQKAALVALTRVLQITKNIYTDSKYAFLIAHAHSALGKGFPHHQGHAHCQGPAYESSPTPNRSSHNLLPWVSHQTSMQ